jgi:carbon monoxide dehydrogenase subunit G
MHFEGQFAVPAGPDDVMRIFADVPRMAQLFPGAAIEGRDGEDSYRGSMLVAFGPKRIKFNGGEDASDARTSTVCVSSDFTMGGVLADFARTGGVAVAKALMDEFATRLAAECASNTPQRAVAQSPLRLHSILWAILTERFARLLKRPS